MRGLGAIKLLLAEDNPDDVEIAIRALRKSRLINDIRVVRDGEEALSLLFPDGVRDLDQFRPDLILLDLNLPKVSGFDKVAEGKFEGQAKPLRRVFDANR